MTDYACMVRKPKKDGIDLFIDVPNVLVAISPLNLQQVLWNLLLNARQALRRGFREGRDGPRRCLWHRPRY